MALDYIPAKVPLAGDVLSVVLQMSTFGLLSIFLSKIDTYHQVGAY